MGFPEDSGAGKAVLAEGWNHPMLSRVVEACRKPRPLLVFARPSGHPGFSKRNPEMRAVMHSCHLGNREGLGAEQSPCLSLWLLSFHRLLAGEMPASSFRMGSQEVGQGRKPRVSYGNQFYLAPCWVTEAENVRSGPWWWWLWATEQISQQAGRTKSQSLACRPALHSNSYKGVDSPPPALPGCDRLYADGVHSLPPQTGPQTAVPRLWAEMNSSANCKPAKMKLTGSQCPLRMRVITPNASS